MRGFNFVLGLALVMLTLGVIFTVNVSAAPSGASVSAGTQERAPAPSVGTLATEGGNVTQVNVTGYTITDKWAGFWGEVSGYIVLADASNNKFYSWSISDPTGGVVYACNGTVSDWTGANIQPVYANDALLPSFLTTGTDSFNYTFTSQETFTSPSLTINNVNYTTTWQNGTQGTDFKTYALKSSADSVLIWAGKVSADKNSFKGGSITADYQILAGVNSQSSATTFYFYMELP